MDTSSILVIDDEVNNFEVIEGIFCMDESTAGYFLHYAPSGEGAIASLHLFNPDLILLDVMMPGIDGLETCRRIKAMPDYEAVPIIMVTSLDTKADLARCLEAGADDFVGKPVNRLELRARVQSMLRLRHQYLCIQDQNQQLEILNTQLEAKVKERTARFHQMIFQDALTKLPSRAFLIQELTQLLDAHRSDFAVISLDCDQFKLVNGSFGNDVGDQLLIAIADRLKQAFGKNHLLVRTGEDRFCLLVTHIRDVNDLEPFIRSILNSFESSFAVKGFEIFTSACLGIALAQTDPQHPEDLLRDANTAMYQAKTQGKGSYCVFNPQMRLSMVTRLTLENDLQRALENEEFITYYQPIINLQTQTIAGFEALVRWQHPEWGLVSPGVFIPSLETTGLIVPVGLVVMRQACKQLYALHQKGYSDLTMSVNLSVRQVTCPTLLSDIDFILTKTRINPACLKLEITESSLMENNADNSIALLSALQSRQIQISLDDFGTGYSSLSYLHRFPINNLKIDRSFITSIQSEPDKHKILEVIITLGHQLGLSLIAEGIETMQQQVWLSQFGCEFGQGYLFSKPLDAESALQFAEELLVLPVEEGSSSVS